MKLSQKIYINCNFLKKTIAIYHIIWYNLNCHREDGRLAQLVRAPALQAGGHRFESYSAHHEFADIA